MELKNCFYRKRTTLRRLYLLCLFCPVKGMKAFEWPAYFLYIECLSSVGSTFVKHRQYMFPRIHTDVFAKITAYLFIGQWASVTIGYFYERQKKNRKNHSRSVWMIDIEVCIFIFANLSTQSYKVIAIWLPTTKNEEDDF